MDEQKLAEILGEDELTKICTELAELIRRHRLQRRPEVSRALLNYFSGVIDGWNRV